MAKSAVIEVDFGSDRVLLYDVHPWNKMGFGVPNFGDNVGTYNVPVHNLADFVGKVQLYIMTHVDAQRTQPPSINTVVRLMKMLNRVQAVLSSRQKLDNQIRTESGHASPDMRSWLIHPAPYFSSGFVRNHWLSEYNNLVMIALANMYQHSDNNLALTVTEAFAADVYKYFSDMKILLGHELLGIDLDEVQQPNFVFDTSTTGSHVSGYNPSAITMNFERMDTPGPLEAQPTEDDLRELWNGIPATIIKSYVSQYPTIGPGAGEGYAGTEFAQVHAARGTADESFISKPGGTIGEPTL